MVYFLFSGKMKKFLVVFVSVLAMSLTACFEKSNHDKAMKQLKDLSEELMSCTTQEQYDVVYEKVIAINNDPKFGVVEGETNEQKAEIIAGTAKVVQEALAVKAILYAMPSGVKPTVEDMKTLVKICLERNLCIILPPHSDVHAMLCEYYKL